MSALIVVRVNTFSQNNYTETKEYLTRKPSNKREERLFGKILGSKLVPFTYEVHTPLQDEKGYSITSLYVALKKLEESHGHQV